MNLRESLSPEHGEPWGEPLTPKEAWDYAGAFVHGWASARGCPLATSTGGAGIRIHNLEADTRSATIRREGLGSVHAVKVAVLAQLDAMPFWERESDTWGPDPWHTGKTVRRDDD